MSNSNDQSINKLENQNLGWKTAHLIKVGKRQRQNLSGIEQKLKQNYFLNTQQLLRHLSPQTTPQIQNIDTLSEYSIKQKHSVELNPKTHKKSKIVNPGNDIISQLRDASANTYSQDSWKKNRRAKSVSQSRQKVLQTSYNRQSFRNKTMNKELSETHVLEAGMMGQQSGGCNSVSKKKIELQKLISKNLKKNKFLIQQNHLRQILEAQKMKQKKQNLSQRNDQVRLNNAKKKKPRSQSCIEGGMVRDKLRNRSLDQVKKDFVSVDDFKQTNLIDQLNQLTHQMEKEISSGSQKHPGFKRQTRNNLIQTAPMVKNKQKAFVEKKQPDPFVALKQLVNSCKFENISDQDVGSPDSRRQEGCRPTDVQEFIQKKKKLFHEKKTLEYVKEMDKVLKIQQNLVQLNQYVQKHMRHKSQPFNLPKKSHQVDFVKVMSPKAKGFNKESGEVKKKVKNISELGFKQEKQSGARKKKLKERKFETTKIFSSTQNKNLKNVILNENSERIMNNEDRKDYKNKKQQAQIYLMKSPISSQSQTFYNSKQEVTFNPTVKIKNVFGKTQQNSPSESNNESKIDLIQKNQIEYSNQKVSPQSIEKLRRIQELVGLYRCKFKEGTSDASIMGKLHSAASVIQINFRYIKHLRSIMNDQFDKERVESQQYQMQQYQQNQLEPVRQSQTVWMQQIANNQLLTNNQQYLQQSNIEQYQVQNRLNKSIQESQNQDYSDHKAISQISGVNNIKNINMSTQSKQMNDTFILDSRNQNTQQKPSPENIHFQAPTTLKKDENKSIYQDSLNISMTKHQTKKSEDKNDLKISLKSRSQTVNNNLIHEDLSKEISDRKSLQKLNTSQAENSMYRNPQVPGLNLQKLGVQTSLVSNSDISSGIKKKSADESSSILNPSAQVKPLEKIQKERSPNLSLGDSKMIEDYIKIENLDESFQKQLLEKQNFLGDSIFVLQSKEKSGGRVRAQSNDADDRYQNELEEQSKQEPVSESNYSEIFNRIGLPLPKSARVQIDYNLVKRDPGISEQIREVIMIKKEKGIEVLKEAKKFNLISERTTIVNQIKLEKWVTSAMNRIDQEKIGTQSRRSFGAVSLGEFSGHNAGKQSITNEELIKLAVNGKQHLNKLMGAGEYEKLSARSGTNEKISARSIRQQNSFRSQSWRANGVSGINSQTDFDKIDPYQNSNVQNYKNKNQKLVGLINKNSSRSSTHQEQQQDLSDRSSGRQASIKVDEANQESIKKVAQIEKQLENALEKQNNEVQTLKQKGLIFVENQAQEASFSSGAALNSSDIITSIKSSHPVKINNSVQFKHDSSLFDGSQLDSEDNKDARGSGQKNASSTWIDESIMPSEDDKKQKDFQEKKLQKLINNFVQDGDQNQQNNMLVSPLSSQQIYEFKIQTGAHSLSSNDSDMQGGLRASLHEPLDSPPDLLSPKSVGGISITVGGGGISLDQKSYTISPQSQSLSQVVSGSGIPLRKNDGDIDHQLISDSSQQKLEQEQENPQIAFIADKFSETILQVLLYDLQYEMDFVIPRKGKEENLKKQKGLSGGYQIKFFDKKGIKTDLFAIEKYVDEILEEVKMQSKEFMKEIQKPVNQDELLVLYQIQTSEIGNFTHFQPKLPDILSLDLYLRIEKRRKESREKGHLQSPISDGLFDFENVNESDLAADRVDKNFLAECLHIHNKIIFDCINDSLQQFRPNGKEGLPKSWSSQNRKLKATEDFSLEEMFEITKHDLFRMAIMQAGTLPRREFVFSGQFDEDLFGEIREKKLATLLCREIVDTESQWLRWEFEESQTKIDIADMVLEQLIVETVDFLNQQKREASLQF